MMSSKRIGRGAWGGVLLLLAPALATAQDRPATGPSTTEPETNKNSPQNPLSGAKPVTPKSPAEILPGVPATATDPAPPGTRSVRVDLPPAGTVAPLRRPAMGMKSVEGIVTAINKKGGDLKNETIRLTVDPAQGWESYLIGASAAPATPVTGRPGDPALAPIEIVLTGRTYTFAHARTPEGVDLIGVTTESSPDDARLRSDALGSHMRLQKTSDPETSWTNIKVGSYVSVRFQKVGDLNEARNVSLIQLPLNPEATSPAATRVGPGRLTPRATTGGAPIVPETKSPTSPGASPH